LDNFGGTSGALGAKPKSKDGPKVPEPKIFDIKTFFKPQISARKTEDDVKMDEIPVPQPTEFTEVLAEVPL
jgi:hypothetical protein